MCREADDAEIKKAYKKLCLKWHPDKNAVRDSAQEAPPSSLFLLLFFFSFTLVMITPCPFILVFFSLLHNCHNFQGMTMARLAIPGYKKAHATLHVYVVFQDNHEQASRAFVNVSTAFSVLSDEDKRRRYDVSGKEGLDDQTLMTEEQAKKMANLLFKSMFSWGYQEGTEPDAPDHTHGRKQAIRGAVGAPLVGVGAGAAVFGAGLLAGGASLVGGVVGSVRHLTKGELKEAVKAPISGVVGAGAAVLAGTAGGVVATGAGFKGAVHNVQEGRKEVDAAKKRARASGVPSAFLHGRSITGMELTRKLEEAGVLNPINIWQPLVVAPVYIYLITYIASVLSQFFFVS